MTNKITILAFVQSYIPGYRAGGPIRSISGLVEMLGDEFNFKIITADHDFGVFESYPGITPNTWCKVGKAEVYYATGANLRFLALARLINSIDHDILYLNSFFSPDFTIKPLLLRRLKLILEVRTILAPRGEFSSGALQLKWFKKKCFIKIIHQTKLYENLLWQASSNFEQADILNLFRQEKIRITGPVIVAPDLASHKLDNSTHTPHVKKPGVLDIVFLSRISPMKNLDGALTLLNGLQGDIAFNIFGPTEDQHYLDSCQKISANLGSNIKVVFHGEVNHDQVFEIFRSHHLFFLPTLGENFGHVILEALLAGCPVLLSDQTPWKNLENLGVGWDLPLNKPDKFRTILEQFVGMDNGEFTRLSSCSANYAANTINDPVSLEQNRHLFHSVSSS